MNQQEVFVHVLLALIVAIVVWMFVKKEKFDLLVLDEPSNGFFVPIGQKQSLDTSTSVDPGSGFII